MMDIRIDYELAKKNHMKTDAEKALKMFLNGEVGTCFILFPQALNPFLKTLESLGIWRQALVLPSISSEDGGKVKPAYLVVKITEDECVSNVKTAVAE